MHDFYRKDRQLYFSGRRGALPAGVHQRGQEMDKCRKNVHGVESLSPEGFQEVLGTYILVFIHLYRKARGQRVIPFGMQGSSSREKKETRWATSCRSGESS